MYVNIKALTFDLQANQSLLLKLLDTVSPVIMFI